MRFQLRNRHYGIGTPWAYGRSSPLTPKGSVMIIATIYHDIQDPADIGWAYRIHGGESGPIDSQDAIDAIHGLIDQTDGDLAASLAAISAELPASVQVVRIAYAEDCHPLIVDLHP